ncbi:unnamed protein product [Aphanomyces euteiches]
MVPLATAFQKPSSACQLDDLLHQWLAHHGPSRLPLLYKYLPHFERVVLLHAVTTGQIDILPTFEPLSECPDKLVDVAAAAGQLQVVRHLLSIPYTAGIATAMTSAASHGHLHIVKYLTNHRSDRQTPRVMDAPAANGHLEVVRFLHYYRREGCTTQAMDQAAANGHLEVCTFYTPIDKKDARNLPWTWRLETAICTSWNGSTNIAKKDGVQMP